MYGIGGATALDESALVEADVDDASEAGVDDSLKDLHGVAK